MKTIEEIKAVILENMKADRDTYDGLTTEEIAKRSRHIMFGEDGAGYPGDEEWSRIVD